MDTHYQMAAWNGSSERQNVGDSQLQTKNLIGEVNYKLFLF